MKISILEPSTIRQLFCVHCGGPATKEVRFAERGGTVVEKYCSTCIEPKAFARIKQVRRKVPEIHIFRKY